MNFFSIHTYDILTVSSVLQRIPYISSRSLLCRLLWWKWKRKKVFLSKDCCNAVWWDFGQTFWKCHECWKTSSYQRFWCQNSDKLFLLCWTQGISYYLATLAQYKIAFKKDIKASNFILGKIFLSNQLHNFLKLKKDQKYFMHFIPFFVFGFWSLLMTKLRKYYEIFVYIL